MPASECCTEAPTGVRYSAAVARQSGARRARGRALQSGGSLNVTAVSAATRPDDDVSLEAKRVTQADQQCALNAESRA